MLVTVVPRFFFFNDTATTEIYTLSLHDALPISRPEPGPAHSRGVQHFARHPDPAFHQDARARSEEHTSELQSQSNLVCRLLLEKKKIGRLALFAEDDEAALQDAVTILANWIDTD